MFGHSDKMLLHGREGRKTEHWLQNWQLLLAVTTSCESRGMKWWHNLWTGCFMCWHANGDSPHTTQYQEPSFLIQFYSKICFFFLPTILFTHLTTKPSAQQCFPWFSKRLVGLCTHWHRYSLSYRHNYSRQHDILGLRVSLFSFLLYQTFGMLFSEEDRNVREVTLGWSCEHIQMFFFFFSLLQNWTAPHTTGV